MSEARTWRPSLANRRIRCTWPLAGFTGLCPPAFGSAWPPMELFMAESVTWNLTSPEQEEAFLALILRYLDGLATRQEMGRLNDALRVSAVCRDFFVQVTCLQGAM